MSSRKKVTFWSKQVEKVPVRVKFTTDDGRKISFTATKAVSHRGKVSFYTKKKK